MKFYFEDEYAFWIFSSMAVTVAVKRSAGRMAYAAQAEDV